MELFASITGFVAILAAIVVLRSKGSAIEIRFPDIVVAVLPIMIYLIVSGKLTKFEISESGIKLETAIKDAAKSEIAGLQVAIDNEQVPSSNLPTESVSRRSKGGVQQIPRLINEKTEALSFNLGYNGYYGPAIREYLQKLTSQPFLKYLIFYDQNGKFYGVSPATKFVNQGTSTNQQYADLASWLRDNNTQAIRDNVPGFIGFQDALNQTASRSQALEKMIDLQVDKLPMLDSDGNLLGMVDRTVISSSLLLDIARNVNKNDD